MRGPLLAAALSWAVAAAGCGSVTPTLDSNSDGDHMRDNALAVFVDRTVTDRIDGSEGDNTDWKYVDVLDRGQLRVTVGMDTPQAVRAGEISFHDAFGTQLDRFLVTGQQTSYVFTAEVEKIPNKYFVRVFSESGASTYSVGATLAFAPAPPAPTPVRPFQPPVVEMEPEPAPAPSRQRTRRPKVTSPKRAPTPVAPKPPPAPAVSAAVVTGKVVRIAPSSDGAQTVVTLQLGPGTVPDGASGGVFRGGDRVGTVRITKGGSKRVQGVVDQPPGKLTGSLSVKFSQ